MKTIKMLKDFMVAVDGFTVVKWLKGEIKEDVPDHVADDLTHEQTLAAVEVTGNKKDDAAAEAEAVAAQKDKDDAEAAAKILEEAQVRAALEAAGTTQTAGQ